MVISTKIPEVLHWALTKNPVVYYDDTMKQSSELLDVKCH